MLSQFSSLFWQKFQWKYFIIFIIKGLYTSINSCVSNREKGGLAAWAFGSQWKHEWYLNLEYLETHDPLRMTTKFLYFANIYTACNLINSRILISKKELMWINYFNFLSRQY